MKEESVSFGSRNCELEQRDLPRIEAAEAAGWTDVHYVYDDLWGGLYLGGIDPTGKWGHVPETPNAENQAEPR